MPATTVSVTRDIAYVGMKVYRGKDWKYGNQDKVHGEIVPGEITDLRGGSEDWVTVKWKGGSPDGQRYRVGPSEFDLYLWEEDIPGTISTGGYERLKVKDDIQKGDILIGMPDSDDSVYFYKQAKITPGNLYEVQEVGTLSSDCTFRAVLVKEAFSGYWVGVTGFAMYKKAAKKDPWEGEYITSPLQIGKGDRVVFRRHLEDSSAANISIGEEVEIVFPPDGNKHIRTNKKDNWWVPIGCFTLSRKAEKIDPYKDMYLTTTRYLEIGDRLIYRKHEDDSTSSNISIGEEVEITCINELGYVQTNKREHWIVPITCFTFARKGVKKVEEVRKKMDTAPIHDYKSAEEYDYEMTHSGPRKKSTKSSPISSNIKTEDYVRNKSVISSRRECGYAIKIQATPAKIRQGKDGRQRPVQLRSSEVKVRW